MTIIAILFFVAALIVPFILFVFDSNEAPTSFAGALKAPIAGTGIGFGGFLGSNLGRFGRAFRDRRWSSILRGIGASAIGPGIEMFIIGRQNRWQAQ